MPKEEATTGEAVADALSTSADTAEVEQEVIDAATERGRKETQQSIRTLLRDAGVIAKDDARDWVTISRELGGQLVELRALADDARAYRKAMLDEAIVEGVRAIDGFSEESYRGLLTNAPLDTIKRMRDDWKKIADDKIKGGRHTTDDAQTNGKIAEFVVPASVTRG